MAYSELIIQGDRAKILTAFQHAVSLGIGADAALVDSGTIYQKVVLYYDEEKTKKFFQISRQNAAGGNNWSTNVYNFWDQNGRILSAQNDSRGIACSTVGSNQDGIHCYRVERAYLTDYGVAFIVNASDYNTDGPYFPNHMIILTKNQNNKPVVVFSYGVASSGCHAGYVQTAMNTEYALASTDTETLDAMTRTNVLYNAQTVITPFLTRAGVGEISYTPNAGRLLACNFWRTIFTDAMSEMTFDGAVWLTNGCWCLKAG